MANQKSASPGNSNEAASYEQELERLLQERIKPGLNRGTTARLARTIAKEIAHQRPDEGADEAGEPSDEPDEREEDDDVQAETDEDFSGDEDGNEGSLEDELRHLQADLGDNWILRVSLQGEDAWLTAEKNDGSQHVEARAAHVLAEVVELLNESGGRTSAARSQ